MHPNFPMDPVTIAVGVIALLSGIFGFLGGGVIWAIILLVIIGVPLLVVEWLGYFVYERFIEPRRA